jgi:hypothetical protein
MKIFVTGASGFIGRRLLRELLRRGDHVVALTRRASNLSGVAEGGEGGASRLVVLEGDPAQPGAWQQQVAGCDAVVALAGEPVFGSRWTESVKRRLVTSRVEGMRRMVEALQQCPQAERPKTLIAASAVGYYGFAGHGDSELDESSPAGHDFLARLCVDWEAGAEAAAAHGVRVVRLRIGVVLGEGGGALEKMVPVFRAFLGGPLGSGDQYLPWVHLDDIIGLILLALQRGEVHGALNAVGPQSVTMRELAQALGAVLHRPSFWPVPSAVLKVMLGEAAQVLLGSQRVVPRRAIELGYRFQYSDLREALRATLR